MTLACALLMVSRFRYPHLVNQFIRGKRPFGYLVKLVLVMIAALIFAIVALGPALAFFTIAYVFAGPVVSLYRIWRKPTATAPAPKAS